MIDKAGVIGLGIMGSAMAGCMVKKGFEIYGYDVSPKALRRAAKFGVHCKETIAECVSKVDIVVCSLPSPEALTWVCHEIINSADKPLVLIETSTLTIDDKLKAKKILKKNNHQLLDCPISGTGQQALKGDISVFASGDEDSIKKSGPVISAFSRENRYCGVFGNGSRMKFVANLLVTIHNTASAEALTLGIKAGLDPALIFDVISTSAATSRMFQVRGGMMINNKYDDVGMSNRLYQKDLDIISEFASNLNCPVNLFQAALPPYREALKQGLGEKDTASVFAVLKEQAGIKR
tara:strand:+ start:1025 stop:1903 length:879 start_codon:yes stop_codon:yes gene_type:complete